MVIKNGRIIFISEFTPISSENAVTTKTKGGLKGRTKNKIGMVMKEFSSGNFERKKSIAG